MDDLEKKLHDAVAGYVAGESKGDDGAQRRDLCAVIAFIAEARLKDESEWPPHWWIDGLLDDAIEVVSPFAISLRGKLIAIDERDQWWLEPLEAVIELGQSTTERATYRLRIGDATRGLRAIPYGSFDRRERAVTNWIFDVGRS